MSLNPAALSMPLEWKSPQWWWWWSSWPDEEGGSPPFILGSWPSSTPPVLAAMWLSISWRAFSTFSGRPVTSKMGSLSRLGVTMYVWVCCWIRLIVAPFGPTTSPTTRYGTRTCMVTWPGVVGLGGPGGTTLMLGLVPGVLPLLLRLLARIWLKWSAADSISLLAAATSSRRPVTTNTGSAPLTGVLIYVLVFALNALILQPGTHENKRMVIKSKSFKKHDKIDYTSNNFHKVLSYKYYHQCAKWLLRI